MDPSWWSSDRALSAQAVERVVGRQFPALRGLSAHKLGEGFDSEVFEVGRWVLRFPKRAEVQDRLARERALLPELAAALPLPIPEFELFGEPCAEFPYSFVGYEKLPGTTLQHCLDLELGASAQARLARQLGEFLSALHGFGVGGGLDLPRAEPSRLSDPLDADETQVAALRAVDADLARRLEEVLARPPLFSAPSADLVLIHGDLEPEHVLIDVERQVLSAVIDWGDVEIGPAAGDFVGMYCWRGAAFVAQILEHYAGTVTARDLAWMRARAMHVSLANLSYGSLSGRPIYVEAGLHGLRHALGSASRSNA